MSGSVVLAAKGDDASNAKKALEKLCLTLADELVALDDLEVITTGLEWISRPTKIR